MDPICVYLVVPRSGHKRGIDLLYGPDVHERNCKIKCSATELLAADIKQKFSLKDVRVEGSCCVILGAKRDVDMAGAIIYDRFYRAYEKVPKTQVLISRYGGGIGWIHIQCDVERDLHNKFSDLGAPEWGTEDGIAALEAKHICTHTHTPKHQRTHQTRGNGLEMVWKWFGNGLEMVWKWFGNGLEMVWKWFGNGVSARRTARCVGAGASAASNQFGFAFSARSPSISSTRLFLSRTSLTFGRPLELRRQEVA
jgi:hypothetical protein